MDVIDYNNVENFNIPGTLSIPHSFLKHIRSYNYDDLKQLSVQTNLLLPFDLKFGIALQKVFTKLDKHEHKRINNHIINKYDADNVYNIKFTINMESLHIKKDTLYLPIFVVNYTSENNGRKTKIVCGRTGYCKGEVVYDASKIFIASSIGYGLFGTVISILGISPGPILLGYFILQGVVIYYTTTRQMIFSTKAYTKLRLLIKKNTYTQETDDDVRQRKYNNDYESENDEQRRQNDSRKHDHINNDFDEYKILGLDSNKPITVAILKNAYLNKIKLYHPDVNKNPDAVIKTKEINAAYTILKNKYKF